jgi:hypothetical protein
LKKREMGIKAGNTRARAPSAQALRQPRRPAAKRSPAPGGGDFRKQLDSREYIAAADRHTDRGEFFLMVIMEGRVDRYKNVLLKLPNF